MMQRIVHCNIFARKKGVKPLLWQYSLPLAYIILFQVTYAVAGEALQLILLLVGNITKVPLIGCETYSNDATCKRCSRSEVYDTSAAVVNHVVPSAQNGRVGEFLPSCNHIGVRSQAVGIQVTYSCGRP